MARIADKRITIDPDVWRMVRAAAMLEGLTISEWIEDKLRAELANVLEPTHRDHQEPQLAVQE